MKERWQGFSLGNYLLLVDFTGRLFRDGKAVISAELTGILERLGTSAETWHARLEKLKGGRLLGRFFAANRNACPKSPHTCECITSQTWAVALAMKRTEARSRLALAPLRAANQAVPRSLLRTIQFLPPSISPGVRDRNSRLRFRCRGPFIQRQPRRRGPHGRAAIAMHVLLFVVSLCRPKPNSPAVRVGPTNPRANSSPGSSRQ